jgi:hypothetical protein
MVDIPYGQKEVFPGFAAKPNPGTVKIVGST